jgi:hypothetical protein
MASTTIVISLKVEARNNIGLQPKGDGKPLGRGSV